MGWLHAAGNFAINLVNNTQDPNIKIYILIKGINPTTKKPTFIKFEKGAAAVGNYADIKLPDTDIKNPTRSLEYSYEHTAFKDTNGTCTLHVPYLESGRIYICLNEKLKLPVLGTAPNLTIADPNPFDENDPNYNHWYDKLEFFYLHRGSQTMLSPSAIDYISLPIAVSQKKMVQGQEIIGVHGIQTSRASMFKTIESIIKQPSFSSEWQRLLIRNEDVIVRMVAPGKSDTFFDTHYLDDYITALWTYYKDHTLTIDCKELRSAVPGLGSYKYTGKVQKDDVFEFKNETGSSVVNIKKPESKHFFLATQGPFDAPANTVQAVIVRNICAAWSVGLLPVPEIHLATGSSSMLGKEYYLHQKDNHNFYKENVLMSATGSHKPWYNLYAKALHAISSNMYAWVYDDALGFEGTNISTDAYPATITIGPMKEAQGTPVAAKGQPALAKEPKTP